MEINGSVCQTFYVDGNDSGEYSFSLGREPEEGQIHKLTAIMTAYSDVLTADQDDVPFSTKDSIILNFDLIIGDAKDMTTFSHKAETEEELYDTQGSGIVINTFTDEIASKVPQKEVHVNAGEELTLQYHAGGYTENDFLIFVTAGYEQMRLNGENYLYFEHLPSRKMAAGFCQMSTPDTPGRYEVMGYVIPDPFSDSGVSDEHADESYRFTLVVE
ncbi:MAG: hypothetical protein Q4C82_07680 [Eubacteriales bacterium]|nr:hypothetical protein [Eubacteriales bacterium]